MKKYLLLFCITALGANTLAQGEKPKTETKTTQIAQVKAVAIKPDATPLELAKAALQAHGGDKLKNLKSLTQVGTADVSVPNSTQTLAVSFKQILSGDKFRFEINAPVANFQQIYDGENLFSSFEGTPPFSKLGLNLLTKIEQQGYKVEALPDKKKRRAFRIITPEGYSTDFYIDATTGQVLAYDMRFTARGNEVVVPTENDKFKEVEGVLIPEKFSQRLEFRGMTFYASYKTKEILVNTAISDDVFAIP